MTGTAPRLCVIVPAFDAVETLPAVLQGVERWGVPVIVVDDGSRDGTREWLERWRDESAGAGDGQGESNGQGGGACADERIVVIRAENGGKAAALRDGFARALELGFDAAITIDADGQHDPADAPRLIERFVEHLRTRGVPAIVCGERDAGTPGYPLRNLAGRRLNDLAIRAQTGVRVSDCPCGLRVYPLDAVRRVRGVSGRFAWEEEFLTRAIWAGFDYERVPIRCIYGAGADGAHGSSATEVSGAGGARSPRHRHRSHYRFRRDWPEGIAVNLWLVVLALLPPAPTRRSLARFGGQIIGALSPARAIEHLAGDSPARLHGAAAMAIGAVGFGFFPRPVDRWTVAPLVAAWIVVRLHGSLLLAIGAGALAWSAARMIGAASASGHPAASVAANMAPILAALLLLLVPSVTALRRRAP